MVVNGTCTADAVLRASLAGLNATNSTGGTDDAAEGGGGVRMVIGIGMGLFGSIGINFAQNGQAISLHKEHRWRWWAFTGLFALAAITNFVAFGFAPTTVLAPLEGTQFVANFVWNYFARNKRLFKRDRWGNLEMRRRKDGSKALIRTNKFWRIVRGTLTVIAGVLLTVFATPTTTVELDEEALWCMWQQLPWVIYLSVTTMIGVALGGAYLIFRKPPGPTLSTDRGEQLLYAIPAATIGGFAVANAKIISIILEFWQPRGIWDFGTLLTKGITWMTVAFVAGGFVLWLRLLDNGPKIYDPLTAIPLLQGAYILFSSTAGGIFFEDFQGFEPWRHFMYWSGIFVILAGLLQLVPPEDAEDRQSKPGALLGDQSNLAEMKIGAGFMPVLISVPHPSPAENKSVSEARVPLMALKA